MTVIIGSARHDENGRYSGGKAGSQIPTEVSTQAFYNHSKKWFVLRPKSDAVANLIAEAMRIACDNDNLGYDQSERLGVIRYGVKSAVKTECDCSSLVRACCIYAGFDPGDFYTGNEVAVLEKTGKFETHRAYENGMKLETGSVLVTQTKGHTVVVTSGASRGSAEPSAVAVGYSRVQFIKDLQRACGASVDGVVGPETRNKVMAITVSAKTHKNHAVVTPLERYFKSLGFYNGEIEADQGKAPCFGAGMTAAVKKYQKEVVKASAKNQDGVISKNGATWKKLLA